MTNATGLKTRERMLTYIVEYLEDHGYAPTYREICDNCFLASTSAVHAHMQRMFYEGVLETDAVQGSPRAYRVPGYEFKKKKERKPREKIFDDSIFEDY